MQQRVANFMRRIPLVIVATLLAVALGASAAAACPSCKDQLDGESGRAFFWSILFMMGAPFGVTAAAVTGIIVSTKRRETRTIVRHPASRPEELDRS
jgi:hypothetical protein